MSVGMQKKFAVLELETLLQLQAKVQRPLCTETAMETQNPKADDNRKDDEAEAEAEVRDVDDVLEDNHDDTKVDEE